MQCSHIKFTIVLSTYYGIFAIILLSIIGPDMFTQTKESPELKILLNRVRRVARRTSVDDFSLPSNGSDLNRQTAPTTDKLLLLLIGHIGD
jgi:hypothetical protein